MKVFRYIKPTKRHGTFGGPGRHPNSPHTSKRTCSFAEKLRQVALVLGVGYALWFHAKEQRASTARVGEFLLERLVC